MPKKFATTNTKAVEARVRKEAVRQAEKSRKEQEAEDAFWQDDDKTAQKKSQRKDEKEKKKQEVLDRKEANKQALEEEMSSIKVNVKAPIAKVTRGDITTMLETKKGEEKSKRNMLHDETPLEENVNRLTIDGDEARTVDEAISVLSTTAAKLDRHPERRLKAAYDLFEETNLPGLKAENPNMRLSQLKQMLKKDWMRSPENPLNQRHLMYNSKT